MPNTIYNSGYVCTECSMSIGEYPNKRNYNVKSSDIISVSIIHRYDTATYPIIRLRMYADMGVVENINDDPDHIFISLYLSGNIYRIEEDDHIIVQPINPLRISGNGYIENKNIPVSRMEQYKMGIKDKTDLNVDSKVPFELFIYYGDIIHAMRRRVKSIYRNTTIETVCRDILKGYNATIDPIQNQKRYDQILIPNMTAIEAFSYFDRYYGLYPNGGSLYFSNQTDEIYLTDTAINNGTVVSPIYVRTEKEDSSNASGIFKYGNKFFHQTQALNASVLSETDIERVMNPEIISDININTLQANYKALTKLFGVTNIDDVKNRIEQKNILHKTDRKTISIQEAARLNERITHIDLSGAGFDISVFKPNTRLNLIFESPIRGLNIAEAYRIKFVCHTLTNSSGDIFLPQTTMQLCSN